MNNMKILVIRLKQIGDSVLALPLCKSLRKTWPDAEIHYLLYEHIAPLFTHSPAIDKVQVFTADERRHPVQYLKKVLALRREKYDLVIDIMAAPAPSPAAQIAHPGGWETAGNPRRRESFCPDRSP